MRYILAFAALIVITRPSVAQGVPEGFPLWQNGAPLCYRMSDRVVYAQNARVTCLANEAATQHALAAQWMSLPAEIRKQCSAMANDVGSYVALERCVMIGLASNDKPSASSAPSKMKMGMVNVPGARYPGMVPVPTPRTERKEATPVAPAASSSSPRFSTRGPSPLRYTPSFPAPGIGLEGPAFEAPPPLPPTNSIAPPSSIPLIPNTTEGNPPLRPRGGY